jgi:predicted ester cyclase
MSSKPNTQKSPAYGSDNDIVDFILGITFDIWEKRQVKDIFHYYSDDVVVYGLDHVTRGASEMVAQTRATLKAFPDRLLLGDDVICAGDTRRGYSSHRVLSPMTSLGESVLGPATGKRVFQMNIADCEVRDGLITREWLVRDNLALVNQLGFDATEAARKTADRFDETSLRWLDDEFQRVSKSPSPPDPDRRDGGFRTPEDFARKVLECCWKTGNLDRLEAAYAPYCVLHRAPVRIFSGRTVTLDHYKAWRKILPDARLSIDHVCSQPYGDNGVNIAARWGIAGVGDGAFAGIDARGKPLFILGVTHWRVVGGRIVSEWTVFDEIAIAAQLLYQQG